MKTHRRDAERNAEFAQRKIINSLRFSAALLSVSAVKVLVC
jgi:hypothetical protein